MLNEVNFKTILGRPIAFHRCYVPLVGVKGAVWLSQAVYWSNITKHEDSWFYHSIDEWEQETGLTKKEQMDAEDKLIKLKILQKKHKRSTHELWYQVNFTTLSDLITSGFKREKGSKYNHEKIAKEREKVLGKCQKGTCSEQVPKGNLPSAKRELTKCQKGTSYIRNTENTTETTSESFAKSTALDRAVNLCGETSYSENSSSIPDQGKKSSDVSDSIFGGSNDSAREEKNSAKKEEKETAQNLVDSILAKYDVETPDFESNPVNQVMAVFYEFNHAFNFGNKTQRSATEKLIKVHGLELVTNAAKAVLFKRLVEKDKFCPSVENPLELERKWLKVLGYLQLDNNKSSKFIDVDAMLSPHERIEAPGF